jgi:hypothetical protein
MGTQHAFPEQLLVGRTLGEQADNLAQWILGGYTALTIPLSRLRPSSP